MCGWLVASDEHPRASVCYSACSLDIRFRRCIRCVRMGDHEKDAAECTELGAATSDARLQTAANKLQDREQKLQIFEVCRALSAVHHMKKDAQPALIVPGLYLGSIGIALSRTDQVPRGPVSRVLCAVWVGTSWDGAPVFGHQ